MDGRIWLGEFWRIGRRDENHDPTINLNLGEKDFEGLQKELEESRNQEGRDWGITISSRAVNIKILYPDTKIDFSKEDWERFGQELERWRDKDWVKDGGWYNFLYLAANIKIIDPVSKID